MDVNTILGLSLCGLIFVVFIVIPLVKPLVSKPNIQKLREQRKVPDLSEALRHRDWQIRRDAAHALGEFADLIGFPDYNWENEPTVWPSGDLQIGMRAINDTKERMKVISSRDVQSGLRASAILGPEEILLGYIEVKLPVTETDQRRVSPTQVKVYYAATGGRRNHRLVDTTGISQAPPGHDKGTTLYVTNRRLLVATAFSLPSRLWEESINAVHHVRIKGRDALVLDYNDDDPLVFGEGAYFTSSYVEEWVDACNDYLNKVVHCSDSSARDSYVQFMQAMGMGGGIAVESLVRALNKEKEEPVKSEIVTALENIGGPKAKQVLAKYHKASIVQ